MAINTDYKINTEEIKSFISNWFHGTYCDHTYGNQTNQINTFCIQLSELGYNLLETTHLVTIQQHRLIMNEQMIIPYHTGFQHELRPEIGPSSRKTLRRRRLRCGVVAARGSSARGTLPKCLKAYASGRVSSFGYGATLACCEVSAALQCDRARWRPRRCGVMLKLTLQLSAAAVFILGCGAVAKRALPQISSTSHRRRSGAACARPSSGPATAACRSRHTWLAPTVAQSLHAALWTLR